MKKLLLILSIPISLLLVNCGGGGSDDLQPIEPANLSLEETLIGKKWCLSNQDENGFKLSENGEFMITEKCTPHITLGSWIIEDSLIKYSYIDNSIQTTVLWGEITEYSANEVKVLIYSNSTTTAEYIYSLTPLDIYGCKDVDNPNYNPSANCYDDIYCVRDRTYIADNNFEQALINLGLDNTLNDTVFTAAIDTVTYLNIYNQDISNLTGIEAFTSLTSLRCVGNPLTSLNVSQNLALTYLECQNNQLTSLDVSNNTALTQLRCYDNQLTSLDVNGATALTYLRCIDNQLTSLDVSQNSALTSLYCYDNQLTSLDVNGATALTSLRCGGNQLTSLDVSQNTTLDSLGCSGNQLTSLDLRNGNNPNFLLDATNNPSLYCIDVDNETWANSSTWEIPSQSFFSEDCGVK